MEEEEGDITDFAKMHRAAIEYRKKSPDNVELDDYICTLKRDVAVTLAICNLARKDKREYDNEERAEAKWRCEELKASYAGEKLHFEWIEIEWMAEGQMRLGVETLGDKFERLTEHLHCLATKLDEAYQGGVEEEETGVNEPKADVEEPKVDSKEGDDAGDDTGDDKKKDHAEEVGIVEKEEGEFEEECEAEEERAGAEEEKVDAVEKVDTTEKAGAGEENARAEEEKANAEGGKANAGEKADAEEEESEDGWTVV